MEGGRNSGRKREGRMEGGRNSGRKREGCRAVEQW